MRQSIREATDRFVAIAFDKNPNISDLSDLRDALMKAFDSPRGQNAIGQFNEEELIYFFESDECRKRIRANVGDEEYRKIYGEIERGEVEIQRELPKGMPIKRRQIRVIVVPKRVKVKPHTRAGLRIKPYRRGYTRWQPIQIRFLKVRKLKKMSSRQTITEYNRHFKAEQRSKSSVKSKYYRI